MRVKRDANLTVLKLECNHYIGCGGGGRYPAWATPLEGRQIDGTKTLTIIVKLRPISFCNLKKKMFSCAPTPVDRKTLKGRA